MGRLGWISIVVVPACVELLFLPPNVLARALALIAFIAGACAFSLWLRSGSDSPAVGADAASHEPPFAEIRFPGRPIVAQPVADRTGPSESPPGQLNVGQSSAGQLAPAATATLVAPSRQAAPSRETSLKSSPEPDRTTFPPLPLFGTKRSPAHTVPWLLPSEPAQTGVAADEARVGELSIRGVSIVGAGHRCEDPAVPRQDAYRLGRDRDSRYVVVAVADGVSQSRLSHVGAAIAVETALDVAIAQLNAPTGKRQIDTTASSPRSRTAWSRPPRPVGSTVPSLCCAFVLGFVEAGRLDRPRRAWISWVGDASAWRLDASGWSFVAGDRKDANDGIESGELDACLPLHPGAVKSTTVDLAPGETLAFVTDGVGDVLAMVPDARTYLAQRWQQPPPVAEFVHDVGFEVARQQDDRTAVVVWTPSLASTAGSGR